jgi:UDP:flavonoid glycosyltransferase YjiC (YdhE family)
MRIVLATFGSRGDVQPMLALSLGLKAAGHDVLLAGPPEKTAWGQELGCPYQPIGGNLTTFVDRMEKIYSLRSSLKFVSYVRKEMIDQFGVLPDIISGADLVVGASLVFALSTVAEHMGIRYRYVAFTPQVLPSGYHPCPVFKTHGLPHWTNRMTWSVMRGLDRFTLRSDINKKRKQLGLPPISNSWQHILGQDVIVASDQVVAQVPKDLELSVTQTGYMHLDQPVQTMPELEAFLSAGSVPVYAGFGSMPKQDQMRCVQMIVDAARSKGERVVISKFWDEPSAFSNSDDVFFVKRYPHLDLFSRVKAVIHHGGAGTTATAAVSGVPQIIVPHGLDQYYWGHQIFRSQLGPKPIWRSRLTARKLAEAIQACLSNDRIIQKAKEVGGMIDRKHGLEMTVKEIVRGS